MCRETGGPFVRVGRHGGTRERHVARAVGIESHHRVVGEGDDDFAARLDHDSCDVVPVGVTYGAFKSIIEGGGGGLYPADGIHLIGVDVIQDYDTVIAECWIDVA